EGVRPDHRHRREADRRGRARGVHVGDGVRGPRPRQGRDHRLLPAVRGGAVRRPLPGVDRAQGTERGPLSVQSAPDRVIAPGGRAAGTTRRGRAVRFTALLVLAVLFLLPMYVLLVTGFKPFAEATAAR